MCSSDLEMSNNWPDRFTKQSFIAQLLQPDDLNIGIKINEIKVKHNNELKKFEISFTNKPKVVKYGWGWSAPHLFPANSKELKKCEGGKMEFATSSFDVVNVIDNLRINIKFERGSNNKQKGYCFDKEPFFVCEDHSGHIINELKIKPKNDIVYRTYNAEFPCPGIGNRYIVRWRPA